ncbi:MAG: KEOPS complex subunit Cgi121 [Halodesulfurarchaeum sp.]
MMLRRGRVMIGLDEADEEEAVEGGHKVQGEGKDEYDCTYHSVEAFVDRLGTIGEAHGAAIQAFDARYVAGRGHLESAVEHANRAVERGENVADDRAVEILLYAAGRRQIDRAMEMGVGKGSSRVVIVVDGGDEVEAAAAVEGAICPEADAAADLPEATDAARIRDFFDITDAELEATTADLEALVQERVALLDVEK